VIRWLTGFLDFPTPGLPAGAEFWQRVTAFELSAPRGDREHFATLLPSEGDPYLRVQGTLAGPPGCHLDLHSDDVADTARVAVRLGASVRFEVPGLVVLESPGGLAFCAVRHAGEQERPPPVSWPGGSRSLLDQLCIDIPAARYDTEARFWAELTGWERRPGRRPEFEYLVRPPGMPLRLLLQRLDDGDGPCRAHPDLACDDVAAERERHEELGARVVRTTGYWTTLTDPVGLAYCITSRDPGTGTL
jgi:Glyoxalase-like domain